MARYNLINTVHPEITDTEITSLAYDERPEWMKRWEQTKLIQWNDSNNDNKIQSFNDKNKDFVDGVALIMVGCLMNSRWTEILWFLLIQK